MIEKIRVLPLLIFMCAFTLFVRIETIWAEGQEIAKQEPAKTEQTPAPAADAKPAETTAADENKGDATSAPAADAPKTPTAATTPEPSKAVADPLLFNDSELDILQSLSARRTQLDERERQIEQKEGLLQVTEKRIEEKLAELKALKTELEATKSAVEELTKGFGNKEQQELLSLVKTYETMKPKDAAARFDNLDLPLQVRIARNLKEAKLAPIMAAMDPIKAAKLTTELAKQTPLPGLAKEPGNSEQAAKPAAPGATQ